MYTEHGAESADDALVVVAATIAAQLRVGDVAYRLRDHEIAVLLPATELSDADVVAGRLTYAAESAVADQFVLDYPLRLRAAAVAVVGTAEEILAEATRAIGAAGVRQRWEDSPLA
jgi:GGDEF domain-containing protein